MIGATRYKLASFPSFHSVCCLQYEFCIASDEHCEGLGVRLTWDRQTDRHTWILEDGWLVRATCRTMMGSRGMARCVKMKHRRLGPTRCLRSFQWRRGWTASYRLIWRSGRKNWYQPPSLLPYFSLLFPMPFLPYSPSPLSPLLPSFFSSYSLPFPHSIPHFSIVVMQLHLLWCNYHLHNVTSCDSIQLRTFSMMSSALIQFNYVPSPWCH